MIKLKNILFEAPEGELDSPPEGKPVISLDMYDTGDPPIQNLEQINIVFDKSTGKQTTKSDDWKYVHNRRVRKRRGSYWQAKSINLRGIRGKVRNFANAYTQWMDANTNLGPIGPVVTSGIRKSKRHVEGALWPQWSGDKNFLKPSTQGGVGYARKFADPIEAIFIKYENNPTKAKRLATKFLDDMAAKGQYMTRHATGKAIDLSLFRGGVYGENNNKVIEFLNYAKQNGIIDRYIDERGDAHPHFHVDLK